MGMIADGLAWLSSNSMEADAVARAGGDASKLGSGFMDSNMMTGVKGALKLGMLGGVGGKAHSNVQATPFHYQSNANPVTTLKTGFDYMKNDINVGQGFNSLKNLF